MARVVASNVEDALSGLAGGGEVFDIIFMDPPYRMGFAEKVLRGLVGNTLCTQNTLVIFEEALETELLFVEESGFEVVREKCYKTNKHVFVKKIC